MSKRTATVGPDAADGFLPDQREMQALPEGGWAVRTKNRTDFRRKLRPTKAESPVVCIRMADGTWAVTAWGRRTEHSTRKRAEAAGRKALGAEAGGRKALGSGGRRMKAWGLVLVALAALGACSPYRAAKDVLRPWTDDAEPLSETERMSLEAELKVYEPYCPEEVGLALSLLRRVNVMFAWAPLSRLRRFLETDGPNEHVLLELELEGPELHRELLRKAAKWYGDEEDWGLCVDLRASGPGAGWDTGPGGLGFLGLRGAGLAG